MTSSWPGVESNPVPCSRRGEEAESLGQFGTRNPPPYLGGYTYRKTQRNPRARPGSDDLMFGGKMRANCSCLAFQDAIRQRPHQITGRTSQFISNDTDRLSPGS